MITARNGDIEDLPVLSKGLKKDDFVKFRTPVEGKDYGRVLDIQGTDALVVCSNSRNNLRFSYGRTAETPLSNCLKWNITEIPAMTKKIQLNAAARLQAVEAAENGKYGGPGAKERKPLIEKQKKFREMQKKAVKPESGERRGGPRETSH